METLDSKIKLFLTTSYGDGSGYGYGSGSGYGYGSGYGSGYGYGSGSGYGYGYGDGDGSGYGSGYGDGDGDGDGSGYGDGSGDGDGDGLKSINNSKIYIIDDTPTIIISVRNNIAKGFVLNKDLTLSPCFIVKGNNLFSHGKTLKDASESLQEKILINLPIEERIVDFKAEFSSKTKKYNAIDFYQWHYLLTGSCNMGRKSFVQNNSINLEIDKFTVKEFIELVKNNYGGEVIKQLEESYGN
jgi:hypothetical protein